MHELFLAARYPVHSLIFTDSNWELLQEAEKNKVSYWVTWGYLCKNSGYVPITKGNCLASTLRAAVSLDRTLRYEGNLVPRVFVPYCACWLDETSIRWSRGTKTLGMSVLRGERNHFLFHRACASMWYLRQNVNWHYFLSFYWKKTNSKTATRTSTKQ